MRIAPLAGLAILTAQTAAAELSDNHELTVALDWSLTDASSALGAWTDGRFGKLRYDSNGSTAETTRLALEYKGQIAPALFAHAVLDYVDDAIVKAGLTEAYLEWRPLPSGSNRHRYRFGAFYPAFSLENSGLAWESPYSRSFSAVNAWLGEEIRPVGAEWQLGRPIGPEGSPHELGASVGFFYGNDPAGTLLFWRGWSVHDRQTRLNERLPLAPLTLSGPAGPFTVERKLDPIAEIDDRPGFYAGGEWSYARKARLSLAFYDNRADPNAFRDGQWAWGTRFWHLGAQVLLPGDVGLVVQRMRGDTDWLIFVTSQGTTTPMTALATDEFDASFVLLSKVFGGRHRLSLRRDDFDLWRPGQLEVDHGDAATVAYGYTINPKLELRLEWLEIDSTRDIWPMFYGQTTRRQKESLAQIGFRLVLFDSTE